MLLQSFLGKLQFIPSSAAQRNPVRVLVVDDSLFARAAARTLLSNAEGFRLVGEAASGAEALGLLAKLKVDVVLLDVHMPGMDGPDTARTILRQTPGVTMLAWTGSDLSDDLIRMYQAGCSGYVLKDAGPAELRRAMITAVRGESPVPRRMIPDVLKRIAKTSPIEPVAAVPLTPRQLQVLNGLARGLTNKDLAAELDLTVSAIESHVRNLFHKLDSTNRVEAINTALRAGLITLADLRGRKTTT